MNDEDLLNSEEIMNAPFIVEEIILALKNLLERDETHTIYINKLPLTKKDRELLNSILGKYQIKAVIESKRNKVEYRETAINGVWLGIFFGEDEKKPILETIEITYIPELLKSQKEDIQNGLNLLISLKESISPPSHL